MYPLSQTRAEVAEGTGLTWRSRGTPQKRGAPQLYVRQHQEPGVTVDPQSTPHGKVAAEFASALMASQFEKAHQLLATSARADWPPSSLQEAYTEMVEYFETPPNLVEVMEVMTDWPDKQPKDVGWAYAAIAGDSESEAVTVIVCDENGKHLIRNIEWGRP